MSNIEVNTGVTDTGQTAAAAPLPQASTSRVLVGVAGAVDSEQLAAHAAALAGVAFSGSHVTLAYPGAEPVTAAANERVDLAAYCMPSHEGSVSPWAVTSAAQVAMLRQATELGAKAAAVLHADLHAFTPETLTQLLAPVLEQRADLVLASYSMRPYDGLLNAAILAPLNRALYGRRARFPLAPDFAVSPRLAARLAMHSNRPASNASTSLLWPSLIAAAMDATIIEVKVPFAHASPAGEMELSAVIAQLVGSVFSEMETHAPLWQRVRSAPANGHAVVTDAIGVAGEEPVDTASMINSFLLGSRSLNDVWGLVLPPVTLLDLKRLATMPAEKFRMPDELWVRIVYDFALGYRLRTINRVHLLGALTPLYLGWVASYIGEAASDPAFSVETRAERLARAFEEGKPYLVRRWRWPDRFNP